MKEKIRKSLLELGGINLQVKESKKSKENKRKKLFINLIEDLKYVLNRSNTLDREYGINLLMFEDRYFKIVEEILIEHWGELVAEVVFWWIYDVKDPKESNYYLFEKENNKKHIVKTPTQLYNILKKLKLFKSI
tara:strand:- start:256 stop:657 length:402 start_codon:yes stop_codon:yes gene_type:complete